MRIIIVNEEWKPGGCHFVGLMAASALGGRRRTWKDALLGNA
jgi:hypothetical protein